MVQWEIVAFGDEVIEEAIEQARVVGILKISFRVWVQKEMDAITSSQMSAYFLSVEYFLKEER